MVEDRSLVCCAGLSKSAVFGSSYSTTRGIDTLIRVIQEQIAVIKEKSERCPSEAVSLLQHLSEKWTNLLHFNKTRGVACKLLSVADHFQRTIAIQKPPLSEVFISSFSTIIVDEMVGGVPEEQCSIKEKERVILWTMCLGSFEKMLLDTLRASVNSGDITTRLITETKVISKNQLLSAYAIDYYRCVSLMSLNTEVVHNLSTKLLNMLLLKEME